MQPESMESVTLMPAERHLPTASGTAARGGSIMEMRPRKQSRSVGKFGLSLSKVNPRGKWDGDRLEWQNPARGEGPTLQRGPQLHNAAATIVVAL